MVVFARRSKKYKLTNHKELQKKNGRKAGFLGIFNKTIFYLVLIGLTRCSGQEGELTRFLLNTTHYNNKFRPVKDDNTTVNVEHSLILHRIVKVVSCNCFEIQYVVFWQVKRLP